MFFCLAKNSWKFASTLLGACLWLAACEGTMMLPKPLPEPSRAPLQAQAPQQKEAQQAEPPRQLSVEELPLPEAGAGPRPSAGAAMRHLRLPAGKLSLNADAMPLNEFVHMALGDVLHLNFDVDKAVASRTDPVTLHVSEPVAADQLLAAIEGVLSLYDVGLVVEGQMVRVLPKRKMQGMSPMVAFDHSRMALRLGRVLELIPLKYIGYSEVQAISTLFFPRGSGGGFQMLQRHHAVLVLGTRAQVEGFREALSMVDRPANRAMKARMIRPVFWQAEALAKKVAEVMKLQGVPVNVPQGLQLVAVEEINAIMMFSPERSWLDAATSLMKKLDAVDHAGDGQGIFTYFVRYSDAAKLGNTLSQVLGQPAPVSSEGQKKAKDEPARAAKDGRLRQPAASVQAFALRADGAKGARIVVDKNRNALIFVGKAAEYQKAYQLLKVLDRAPRQVLLEATVADVTLDATTQLGIEWQATNVDNARALTGTLGTLGGLGNAAGGLSYSLVNAAGVLRAKLNALASKGDAKILATPSLLAMDGEKARIQVGTQVAVLNSEISNVAAAAGGNGTGLLRTFNYVDTGVILEVEPVITEQGAVQLRLRQEVSEAGASNTNTPPISKREVETVFSVQSGQTIVIGGLISHSRTQSRTQVPLLGDIPVLGQLFSNTKWTDRSTEMLILITPHVILGPEDADFVTDAMRSRMPWAEDDAPAGPAKPAR